MIYECDECGKALPPGVTACPGCGEKFEEPVPADAGVPKRGFSAVSPVKSGAFEIHRKTEASRTEGKTTEETVAEASPRANQGSSPLGSSPQNYSNSKPSQKGLNQNISPGFLVVAVVIAILIVVGYIKSTSVDIADEKNREEAGNRAIQSLLNPPTVSSPLPSGVSPLVPTHEAKWVDVAEFQGNSTKKTPLFTVGDHWKIEWKTKPGDMGAMNFQIYVFNTTEDAPADVAANIIGANADGTDEYKAGTYYLDINTSQPYVVRVLDLR